MLFIKTLKLNLKDLHLVIKFSTGLTSVSYSILLKIQYEDRLNKMRTKRKAVDKKAP